MAGAVALVGEQDRRLHDDAGAAIHIELTARKPAQVGGVGGIEEQERRLPVRRAEIELNGALAVLDLAVEARLARQSRERVGLEFEIDQFVRPRLRNWHFHTGMLAGASNVFAGNRSAIAGLARGRPRAQSSFRWAARYGPFREIR